MPGDDDCSALPLWTEDSMVVLSISITFVGAAYLWRCDRGERSLKLVFGDPEYTSRLSRSFKSIIFLRNLAFQSSTVMYLYTLMQYGLLFLFVFPIYQCWNLLLDCYGECMTGFVLLCMLF